MFGNLEGVPRRELARYMSAMSDYRNLEVFWDAHHLTLAVYDACRDFPSDERFGLRIQIQRSATSVPSNLAEGCGRSSTADLARFVDMAVGSLYELEYQLMLAKDLAYLDDRAWLTLTKRTETVGRKLNGLRRSLRHRDYR